MNGRRDLAQQAKRYFSRTRVTRTDGAQLRSVVKAIFPAHVMRWFLLYRIEHRGLAVTEEQKDVDLHRSGWG